METYRELRSGTVYLWHRMRGRETDVMARRQAVLESVFGKSRIEMQGGSFMTSSNEKKRKDKAATDATVVEVAVEQTVRIDRERQWLGVGDEYDYGLQWPKESRNMNFDYEAAVNGELNEPVCRKCLLRQYIGITKASHSSR